MPPARGVGRSRFRLLTPAALAACLALTPLAPAQGGSQGDSKTLQAAHGLLQRGLHELALAEYDAYLAAHTNKENTSVAQYGKAVCLVRLGRAEEARPTLETLADADGFAFAPDVLMLLAHAEMQGGDSPAAVIHLQRLIAEHPGHASVPQARTLLVESLYRRGDLDGVPTAARAALRRATPDQAARINLWWGLAEAASGRHDQAISLLERALKSGPQGQIVDHARLGLAESLHELGRADDAGPHYRVLLKSDETETADRARYGLARLAYAGPYRADAAPLLDAVIARKPPSGVWTTAVLLRARVAIDQEQPKLARTLLAELAKHPTLADDAAYWSAKSWLRAGQPERAAEELAGALERFPESELAGEMAYDRAVALSRTDDRAGAAAAFQDFIEAHDDHPQRDAARLTRASLLHELGEYDQSRAEIRTLGRPSDPMMRAASAFLDAENLYLEGDTLRAEAAYRRFADDYKGDDRVATAWLRIGACLYERGELDKAEPFLLDAAEAGGPHHQALLLAGDIALRNADWPAAEKRLAAYLESPDPDQRDGARLKLAIALARQGDHQGALTALDQINAGADDATRERSTFERAQSLIALERWGKAEAALHALLERWGDGDLAGPARRHLGTIAQRNGDLEAAAEWFGTAARDAGDLGAGALYDRGRAELALAKHSAAARTMQEVLAHKPGPNLAARARAVRAIALSRAGDPTRALEEIDALTQRDIGALGDELAGALAYERAHALSRAGDDDQAARAYAALADDPGAPADLRSHAAVALAAIEIAGGRHADAAKRLDAALTAMRTPGGAPTGDLAEQATYQRALCARELGDHATVARLLADFSKRWPDSSVRTSADLVCAESLTALGRHAEAIVLLTRLTDRASDDAIAAPALLRLGDAHAILQRWARSEEAFTAFIDRFEDHDLWFQARFGIGWARENQGRRTEAIESYREVVDRHNGATAARAQFQIGECLYADRRFDEAVRELLRVDILYAYPQWSAAALYEAGRCFEEMGRLGEARAQFSAVVDRFAESQWARLANDRLAAIVHAPPPGRPAADGATH